MKWCPVNIHIVRPGMTSGTWVRGEGRSWSLAASKLRPHIVYVSGNEADLFRKGLLEKDWCTCQAMYVYRRGWSSVTILRVQLLGVCYGTQFFTSTSSEGIL